MSAGLSLDRTVRDGIPLLVGGALAWILWEKAFVAHSGLTSVPAAARWILVVAAPCAAYALTRIAIRDETRFADAAALPEPTPERELEPERLLATLAELELPSAVEVGLRTRLKRCLALTDAAGVREALMAQYRVCLECERFYEDVAWRIGATFVPVSLGLGTLSLTRSMIDARLATTAGALLLLVWLVLFARFRSSIRLYRDCAMLIERMLGLFAMTYVYAYAFERYGRVVRVWPVLVLLGGLYFDFAVFAIL